MVQNQPCNAGEAGLFPGQGTEIPHAMPQQPKTAPLHSEYGDVGSLMHYWLKCTYILTFREAIGNIIQKSKSNSALGILKK